VLHPREYYKELNQSLPDFSGRCRSCRSFLSSTRSISSGTMDGQSNLHSEVVLVPTPVQFDKQRNSVKELAFFMRLVYVLFCHEAPLSIKMPLSNMQPLELLTNYPSRTTVTTARNTFSRHLWYFSEMLVELSFFDDRIGRRNNADGGKQYSGYSAVRLLGV